MNPKDSLHCDKFHISNDPMAIIVFFDMNGQSQYKDDPTFKLYRDKLVGYVIKLEEKYTILLQKVLDNNSLDKLPIDPAYLDRITPIVKFSRGDSILSQIYPFQLPHKIIVKILTHPKQYLKKLKSNGIKSSEWFNKSSHFACSICIGQRSKTSEFCNTLDTVDGSVFMMGAKSIDLHKSLYKKFPDITQPRTHVTTLIKEINDILNDCEKIITLIINKKINCERNNLSEIWRLWDSLIFIVRSEMDRSECWEKKDSRLDLFRLSATSIPQNAQALVDCVCKFLKDTHNHLEFDKFMKDEWELNLSDNDQEIAKIYVRLNLNCEILNKTKFKPYRRSLNDDYNLFY